MSVNVFYICDAGLCNSDSKFQSLIPPLFLNKIANVGMRFLSLNKTNNLLPILFDFAEIFRFARLPLILHIQIREKPILKIFGDGM